MSRAARVSPLFATCARSRNFQPSIYEAVCRRYCQRPRLRYSRAVTAITGVANDSHPAVVFHSAADSARARARPREWLFEWSGRAITHAGHFSSVCAAAAQMVDRPWKFHAAGVNFSGRQMAGAERERERERCSRERERCPRAMPDENCSSRSSVQNA